MLAANKKMILFVIFLLLGLVASIQVRANIDERKKVAANDLDSNKLLAQIEEMRGHNEALESDIGKVIKEIEERTLSVITDQDSYVLENKYNQLNTIKLQAGLTDVSGPGVIIRLDDAAVLQQKTNVSILIIHDSDIMALLNDLKAAGAQAISINGERIVAMSEQLCAGPTIRINKNRYTVPFEICVIGDPDQLNRALQNSEKLAYMTRDRILVNIRTSRNILIPALNTANKKLGILMSNLEVLDVDIR
jgi:uncharacterized protein YlxW (UPF0749 family)